MSDSDPTCPTCDGARWVPIPCPRCRPQPPEPAPCPRCEGTRLVFVLDPLTEAGVTAADCPACRGNGDDPAPGGEAALLPFVRADAA